MMALVNTRKNYKGTIDNVDPDQTTTKDQYGTFVTYFLANWSHIATLIPGRTDNNILLRYRRLMTWKQQCEDFFAMPVCLRILYLISG